MKIVVYQNLQKDNRYGYQIQRNVSPNDLLVKEQIIPGAYGFPPMYIRHLQIIYDNETVLVVSQTDNELDNAEKQEILAGALSYLTNLEE